MQLFLGNQPGLAGPGQPVDLRTHVVLRNMSAGSVGVSASASFTRGNAVESAPLPDLKLAGNAVGEYDLSALQRQGVIPRGVSEVLLKVDYFAAPGSLMGRAYSISSDLSFGLYSVLETDGKGYFSGVYWSLKDDENTVFTVANIGDKEEAVALNLAYAGGAVELPAFPLLPGQTQTVNLRRDLARMLQGKGQKLPEGAVFGGYQVRSVEDPLRAELVVKEHVLSASKKTAAPFYGSCNYVTSIWLSGASWPTTNVPLGGTKNVFPKCTWNTGSNEGDYGAILAPDGGTEISISPTYGYTRTITGLDLGTRALLMSSDVPNASCGSSPMQASPPPAKIVCDIKMDSVEVVGSGSARTARFKIGNINCNTPTTPGQQPGQFQLTTVRVAVSFENTTGTLNPTWTSGNTRTIDAPDTGDISDWEDVPFNSTGGGTLKVRATIDQCNGGQCSSVNIELKPSSQVTPIAYSVP